MRTPLAKLGPEPQSRDSSFEGVPSHRKNDATHEAFRLGVLFVIIASITSFQPQRLVLRRRRHPQGFQLIFRKRTGVAPRDASSYVFHRQRIKTGTGQTDRDVRTSFRSQHHLLLLRRRRSPLNYFFGVGRRRSNKELLQIFVVDFYTVQLIHVAPYRPFDVVVVVV